MGAPGTRTGSTAAADPGFYASTQNAATAQALARTVTVEQLQEAVADAVAAVTTDGLAVADLSNVNPQTGRTALGLGDLATKSVGQLLTDNAIRTTFAQPLGDLSGQADAPTVSKIRGVAVSGTPVSGQVLRATSSTSAVWGDPANGPGVIDGGTPGSVYGGTTAIDGGTP